MTGGPDFLRAAALNQLVRCDVSLRALGYSPAEAGGVWRCIEPGGEIYLAAIVSRPYATSDAVRAVARELLYRRSSGFALWDPWGRHDLAELGFKRDRVEYLARPADMPWNVPHPPELTVEEVRTVPQLEAFEEAEYRGFHATHRPPGPLRRYGERLLDDGRFRHFIGLVDGRRVGTAQAVIAADVIGVYGVSTVPDARRRGYGGALTRAAAACEPGLPSVLQPSARARGMYERAGFEPAAVLREWAA